MRHCLPNRSTCIQEYNWLTEGDQADNTSSVGNPYFFTGRRFDTETAPYYYRARYYSPIIGRFLQTDPIGYDGGFKLYTYGGNNPVLIIDPSGLCGETRETSLWYDPRMAGPMGVLADILDAACYLHEIPGSIISVALGAKFDRRQRAEISNGFYAGERAGTQIAANEYTFGGTDALGLTSASEKVSEYNKYKILWFKSGSASKFLGARSRDAAYTAASLRAAAWSGKTKAGYSLNNNRYLRVGPGNIPKGRPFTLGPGQNVPTLRIGNAKPSWWNHYDLRMRIPGNGIR